MKKQSVMECDICSRLPSSRLTFLCITCARNALYEPRLEAAQALLENERLGQRIENIVHHKRAGQKSTQADKQDAILSKLWSRETASVKKSDLEEKTDNVMAHVTLLREEIKNGRDEISQRKAVLAKRQAEMQAIKASLPDRRTAITSKLAESARKGSHSWTGIHNKTIDTRAFLCREASLLYRLKQKKKARGGVIVDQYTIGELLLPDLKEINGMRVNELSATLASATQLLVLVAFYLSVRLPAEVTLPHRDYPSATILTPLNSYSARDVPFPGTTPTPSSTNSPTTSRHDDVRPLPRPRPLFLEAKDLNETVAQFAKRDPKTFSFFIEGVSLLAWDIAWLSRTQGHYTGTESWEEICNIGKNLWQLLLAQPQSPALTRVRSSRDVQNRKAGKENSTLARVKSLPRLGSVSHSSAYSFLGSSDAQEFLRGWKLSKYTLIVDPLRKALTAEMNNAEWELLEKQEWDDGGERFDGDAAVHVKQRNMDSHHFDDSRSIMTGRTSVEDALDADDPVGPGRVRGTSGWTKLRGRDK